VTPAERLAALSPGDRARLLELARARKAERDRESRWPTAGAMAADLTGGREAQRAHLDLIDGALADVLHGRHDRVMLLAPPQVGKSRRVAEWGPLYMLAHRPEWRIGVASFAATLARKRSRFVRNAIRDHPETGLVLAGDSAAVDMWDLDKHEGGMLAVGVGGGVTGRSLHVGIIDDPLAGRAAAQSDTICDKTYDWYRDDFETRLQDVGGIVLMQTRWSEKDLAGRLLSEEGDRWKVLTMPALAEDHRPLRDASGAVVGPCACGRPLDEPHDPLGRAPGAPLPHPKLDPEVYRERALRTQIQNPRTFASLLQQRPSPDEGDIFLRSWWRYWAGLRWQSDAGGRRTVDAGSTLITSWDMAFKDTSSSDFVVGQVWERSGADVYLLDQVRDRMSFTATVAAFRQLAARWPQATHLVEEKANGAAVIDSLRAQVPGIVPVTPTESKESRAVAVSPYIEAGNVHLPDGQPWVLGFVEEAAGFPNGAHDDQVDAMTQALARLFLGSAGRMQTGQVRDRRLRGRR